MKLSLRTPRGMKKIRWPLLSLLLMLGLTAVIITIFWRSKTKPTQSSATILEVSPDKGITQSLEVPQKKYPYGFPIEILNEKTYSKDGLRVTTGYCRWHPEADSLLGGQVAVVPVVLYEVKPKLKKLSPVAEVITRRQDGFFALPIPAKLKDYSLAIRIEKAEGCPEKFKQHVPKPKPKRRERPI